MDSHVVYFEVTYANTIAGYTCLSADHYRQKLEQLAAEHPDLELVYRHWSDGAAEDGCIERENWYV